MTSLTLPMAHERTGVAGRLDRPGDIALLSLRGAFRCADHPVRDLADPAFDPGLVHRFRQRAQAQSGLCRPRQLCRRAGRSCVSRLAGAHAALTALSVVTNLAFALGFATLLDSTLLKRGNLFSRLAIFLPVVTPDVAGYVVWRWLYDRSFGAINAGLDLLGLPAFGSLSSPSTAMLAVLIELWHPYRLLRDHLPRQPLDPRQGPGGGPYRRRDHLAGAGVMSSCRSCDLPLMINTVYALIQFLKTFTVVVVMTKGEASDQTNYRPATTPTSSSTRAAMVRRPRWPTISLPSSS